MSESSDIDTVYPKNYKSEKDSCDRSVIILKGEKGTDGDDGYDGIDGVPGLPGRDVNPVNCETINNIYVDSKDGSEDDYEIGNVSKPCKTLITAVRLSVPGNKIIVCGGFYPGIKLDSEKDDIDLTFNGSGKNTYIEGIDCKGKIKIYLTWLKLGFIKINSINSVSEITIEKITFMGDKVSTFEGNTYIKFVDTLFEENCKLVFTKGKHTLVILNSNIKGNKPLIIIEKGATLNINIMATIHGSSIIENRGGKLKKINDKSNSISDSFISESCSSDISESCTSDYCTSENSKCSRFVDPYSCVYDLPIQPACITDYGANRILDTMMASTFQPKINLPIPTIESIASRTQPIIPPSPPVIIPVVTPETPIETVEEIPVKKMCPYKSFSNRQCMNKKQIIEGNKTIEGKIETVYSNVDKPVTIDNETDMILILSDGKNKNKKFSLSLPENEVKNGKMVTVKNTSKQSCKINGNSLQITNVKSKDNSCIVNSRGTAEFIYVEDKGWIKSK